MKLIAVILACVMLISATPQGRIERSPSTSSAEDVCNWKCFASFTKCRMNDTACIKKICHGQQELCGSCSFCSAWGLPAVATEETTPIAPDCETTTEGLKCNGHLKPPQAAINAMDTHDDKSDGAEATTGGDEPSADNSWCPKRCTDAFDQCHTTFEGICTKLVCTDFKLSCQSCPICKTSSLNPSSSIEARTSTGRDTLVHRCHPGCIDSQNRHIRCKLLEVSLQYLHLCPRS